MADDRSQPQGEVTRPALTKRECEVLSLIGQGLSISEIAHQLHRSEKTIQSHRLALGRKLGLRNRVQLARFAIREGITPLEGVGTDAGDAGGDRRLRRETAQRQRLERLFRALDATLLPAPRDDVLRNLVRHVGDALHADSAFIAAIDGERLRTLAFWSRDNWLAEAEYAIANSPCETAIQEHLYHDPACVSDHLEPDHPVRRAGATCYAGVCMQSLKNSQTIGVLALLDARRIRMDDPACTAMRIAAARAACAMEFAPS